MLKSVTRRAHASEYSLIPQPSVSLYTEWATSTPYLLRCPSKTSRFTDFDWLPVCMRPCVSPARVECLFAPVPWSYCSQDSLAFKTKCSGDSIQFQTSRLGRLTSGSELSLLLENVCSILFSLRVNHLRGIEFYYIMNVFLLSSYLVFTLCLWKQNIFW